MRILYVTSYYKPAYVYGGPVTATSQLCESLIDSNTHITVLTTNVNGNRKLEVPLNQPIDVEGVEVRYSPVVNFLPRTLFFSPQQFLNYLREINFYDLIIVDSLWAPFFAPSIIAALLYKKPIVAFLHGQLMSWALNQKRVRKGIYFRFLIRPFLKKISAIFCVSGKEMADLKKLNIEVPTIVIPYGLKTRDFIDLPTRGKLRRDLGIPDNTFLLLYLGRLHKVKNPEIALNAALAMQQPNLHMIFAGPDEQGLIYELKRLSREKGLENNIHFTGLLSRNEVIQALVDSDLLIMPSTMESFGMSVIEAMAVGLPVLISDNIPVGELVERVGAGFVVPATLDAFTNSLRTILNNSFELHHMGNAGRNFVLSQYEIKSIANELRKHFEIIIHNPN